MNKMPVKCSCEFLEISPQTYYRKVDWLYEQALGFVREREIKLLKSFEMKRLYQVGTDRFIPATGLNLMISETQTYLH